MQKFNQLKSIPAYLPIVNIDTDMIIPKQFLKTIKRTGLGKNLFYEMRYDNEGKEIKEFILNQPPFNQSKILITGKNFGCGSSREHAPWALSDFGFKAVLAPSFGDIFYSNSFKNGFLPIRLENRDIDMLFDASRLSPGFKVTINLEKQFVQTQDNKKFEFNIDDSIKNRLLKGLDDIALTLEYTKKIRIYEKNRSKIVPWLFKEI